MESTLADTVQAQGKKLLEQEQRIKELEKRLESIPQVGVMAAEMGNGNEANGPEAMTVVVEATPENTAHNSAALYEFDNSMWDAALLLFFRKGTNWVEKMILIIGCILNLFLQMSLLITIQFNMLESPYDKDTVQEMLRWRVQNGNANANFNDITGKSLLTRLCNQELWTYEQEEFKLMYDYLYKEVPGALLSTLAIVMWVLTIMVEYRRCVEQALAVIHLPRLEKGSEFSLVDLEGNLEIRGMSNVKRILALTLLSFPRLAVMLWLAVIGCQYLAQTVNLGDIVLNAVALAFVMDVDELVANVLLTERLRSILPRIQPLSCGPRAKGKCCPIKDMVRYVITAGLVAFALIWWLIPFDSYVRGAAMALCGGFQDFSYEGGTTDYPSVVLKPASWSDDTFVSSCFADAGETYDVYLQRYYSARYNSSVQNSTETSATAAYYTKLRNREVLKFAFAHYPRLGQQFTQCAKGEILGPQQRDTFERQCVRLPATLESAFGDDGVEHGHRSSPADCARFTTTEGCNAGFYNPEACMWSWLSEKCDGKPPGTSTTVDNTIQADACGSNVVTACETWLYVLNKSHPTYNCNPILDFCSAPIYDCVALRGQYIIRPSDYSLYQVDPDVLKTPFLNVLSARSGLTTVTGKITLILEDAGPGYAPNSLLATLCMKNLPVDYKPLPGLRQNTDLLLADIQAEEAYDSSNGINSIASVRGSFWYTSTSDLTAEESTGICGTSSATGP